ncbi:hypothetical protein ACIBEF_00360 [Micromonospora sp. NPDC050795]|uniref:hypothetical protein n=1 Tax=Micromonospora sp. NPDC050795 TaxID=3364282 RepID=UPI003791954B
MRTTEGMATRQSEPSADASSLPCLGLLALSAGSFAAAASAYVFDSTTPIDVNRGAYALAVCVSIVAFSAWLARTSEIRLQRYIDRRLDEHTERIEKAIRDAPPSVSYLPHRNRPTGQTYRTIAAVAVGGGGDTVPLPTGMDPATAAAVRRINMRLAPRADQQ